MLIVDFLFTDLLVGTVHVGSQLCNYSILEEVECFKWKHYQVQSTPFKVLTVGLSASFSIVSAPSGSTNTLEAFVHSILAPYDVLIAKLVDIVPTYSLVWMAPMMIYCYFSNCCRASVVTSLAMSLMSYKSPSISVIGSNEVLVAFDFFLDPPFSYSLGCLMQPDVF